MKGFIISMICLVLVVAVALTGFLVLNLTGRVGLPNFSSMADLELVNKQAFPVANVQRLVVSYTSERVSLLPSSSDEIVLEEYMNRKEDNMLARISQSGSTLDIRGGERSWFGLNMWRCHIRVYVPAAWLGEVSLSSSSGSVLAEGDFSFQSVALSSTSGSVRAENLSAEGNIALSSSSGSVEAGRLVAGGAVELSSTSGSIRAQQAIGQTVAAQSSSGSVKIERAEGESVALSSTSGSVKVEELHGVFQLKSSSGSVRVAAGTGHGTANSSSGTVEIHLQQLTGNLQMKSTSGSCRLTLPQNTAMEFYGKTNSGSVKVPEEASWNNYINRDNKEVSGTLGEGNALPQVQMQASSGSVRMEWD